MSNSSTGELVVQSVATAVVATAIVESGITLGKSLARQPVILFGVGIALGILSHKYRKEIIALSSHTAEQSKDFIVQQKNHLSKMLAEAQNDNQQSDQTD